MPTFGSRVAPALQLMRRSVTAVPDPSAALTWGPLVELAPSITFAGLFPLDLSIDISNGDDNLSWQIVYALSDGTTAAVAAPSSPGPGTSARVDPGWLWDDAMQALWAEGVTIARIGVQVASVVVAGSTSVATFTVSGMEHK